MSEQRSLCFHCRKPIHRDDSFDAVEWVHVGDEYRRDYETCKGVTAMPLPPRTVFVDYAVIEFASDYPRRWIPPGLSGRWFRIEDMPANWAMFDAAPAAIARAVPRFAANESGQIAQCFEICLRPDQVEGAR